MNIAPLDNLRGDYAGMAPDWTVAQPPDHYSDEEQAVWRLLVERQSALARQYACAEFLSGLETLGVGDTIPDFAAVNARLESLTGWRVVGVPGLIPDAAFYDHLAHRRFPVTVWIRKREELDYLVEPDLFHDFFGHVPLLTDPVFADYMQEYGRRGVEAGPNVHLLARLYWFTVEFGLIRTPQGLKAYGAGILSSAAEVKHAIEGDGVQRVPFDPAKAMQSPYEIDKLQPIYFVLDDFRQLMERPDRH
ncbi:MAG: phenylalanine 4-monooxygenase [Proteobacteria bacterium]|nr:phenylalanine 4-monooxygenase [Pseudomonadota bacterium]